MTGVRKIKLSTIKGKPGGLAELDENSRVAQLGADSINIRRFGAKGDGVTNDTAALLAAIDSGERVWFPAGTYVCDRTLNIRRPILWEGSFGRRASGYAVTLLFPDDVVGIFLHHKGTSADDAGIPILTEDDASAGGSIIRNMRIQRGNGKRITGDGTSHGIWAKCAFLLDNCLVMGFAGNGIHIVAAADSIDPYKLGNANLFEIRGCRFSNSGGHGYYADGPDSNAGLCSLVDCSGSGGWGFFDSSFLGNTFIACHTAANVAGAYKTDNRNAQNALIGCYSERLQGTSDLVGPTVVVGGLHETPVVGNAFYVESTPTGAILSKHAVKGAAGDRQITASMCRVDDEAVTLEVEGDAAGGLSIGIWDESTGCWAVRHKRSSSRTSVLYTTDLCSINAGRSAPLTGGEVVFGKGLFLGGGAGNVRAQTNASAAPTAGEWGQGDIVWNRVPSPGGFAGWICTTAGSPGVWKGFGLIEP